MSKLQNMEHIFCTSCNARMQEILSCVNCRRRVDDDGLPILIRCNYLVCEHCKYCSNCRYQYNFLKEKLIIGRIGRPDQQPQCIQLL